MPARCVSFVRSCFFFFSSRRRHTRSLCDWSSDVCSSDLCWNSGGRKVPKKALDSLHEIKAFLGTFRPPEFQQRSLTSLLEGLILQHEERTEIGRASCRERV